MDRWVMERRLYPGVTHPVRDALPTHYAFAWSDLLAVDVDATDVVRGVLAGLVWATAFGATAVWWFRRKDITS